MRSAIPDEFVQVVTNLLGDSLRLKKILSREIVAA
jgi:hypothetical protein